jgi:protein-S-isoprenylcysteine O-methyltransferase Ste14
MYVGWTLRYLGAAVLSGTTWPLVVLPGVAAAAPGDVLREERRLPVRFGTDFEV